MAIFDLKYLQEKYISKYAKYLDDDNEKDDDEDDEEKKSSSDDKKENDDHLTRDEIQKCTDVIKVTLGDFSNLKKCCDFIDLTDKDKIDDDGEHVSSHDQYFAGSPSAYIQLVDGDVWSGYPDFRDGGQETYEDDCERFSKKVNEMLVKHNIKAKFKVDHSGEGISFSVKSIK